MTKKVLSNNSLPLTIDDVTGALLVDATIRDSEGGSVISPATTGLQKTLLAAQGIMPVRVGFGVATIAAGANAITLHASTACKYFYFFVPTGGSVVYYRPGGAAADAATTPNQPIDATMQGKLVILDTPATSITLWGVSASSVVWVAGNDA